MLKKVLLACLKKVVSNSVLVMNLCNFIAADHTSIEISGKLSFISLKRGNSTESGLKELKKLLIPCSTSTKIFWCFKENQCTTLVATTWQSHKPDSSGKRKTTFSKFFSIHSTEIELSVFPYGSRGVSRALPGASDPTPGLVSLA